MDVRIGVTQTPKEIELDLGEADVETVTKLVEEAIRTDGVLWLTDRRGRRVAVPAAKVAYVEVDASHESRHVGFGVGMR